MATSTHHASNPKPLTKKISESLTADQRRMYSTEKLNNFRWIAKLLASYSPYVLTSKDLASDELSVEVSEIGQFAELVYPWGSLTVEFIFQNLPIFMKPGFPLHGYTALPSTILISAFKGTTADLPAYIVYRPFKKQLIIAIAGTATLSLALRDLKFLKRRHPSGRGKVHAGFWSLYQGIKPDVISSIRKGLKEHEVTEIVVTGHSMGGAMAHLLAFDLLVDTELLPPAIALQITVFGAPRCGDAKLAQYWSELIDARRAEHDNVSEYSIKAYNDGVPALPPYHIGYRHLARTPLYLIQGRIYHIPASESEHTFFHVRVSTDPEDKDKDKDKEPLALPQYPRGGHNYYNGRDLEKLVRKMRWLNKIMSGDEKDKNWEERYEAHLREKEKKYGDKY